MCDDLHEDPIFTQPPSYEDDPSSCEEEPFWWPLSFLEQEPKPPPSQQGGDGAQPAPNETDLINARLTRAYNIIDEQAILLKCISHQMEQMKVEQCEERKQREKKRRRVRELCLLFLNAVLLSSVLIWRQALSQAGWSFFQWLCDLTNASQKSVVGFITAIAGIWLLYRLGKLIWRFTLEDLMEEAEDGKDDDEEEGYPF